MIKHQNITITKKSDAISIHIYFDDLQDEELNIIYEEIKKEVEKTLDRIFSKNKMI
tara:strand:+ start:613 stop:780 length:168 start_codon:yes stop_codon:yes gene_type:complete